MSVKYRIFDATGVVLSKIIASQETIADFLPIGCIYEAADMTSENARKAKVSAQKIVLEEVTKTRAMLVTDIIGQEMIYLKKEAEAKSYIADANPDLSNYPFITSEIGVVADTAYEVAQIFVNMSFLWEQIGSALERARLTAKASLAAAITEADVATALSQFQSEIATLPN